MSKKIFLGLLGFAAFGFYACEQNLSNEEIEQVRASKPKAEELLKQYNYSSVTVPAGFEMQANLLLLDDASQGNVHFGNPKVAANVNILNVTDDKAKLGRVLFYDKKLSLNSNISCGSCHHQDKAFADGQQFSAGFEGQRTSRNSMAIVSPAMQHSGMFWDRREENVRGLSLRPVVNHIEMGMEDLKLLEVKLSGEDYYSSLFTNAYGNPAITSERISDAITAFLRSMITWDSRFDEGVKNSFQNFTSEEKRGMEVFMGKQVSGNSNDPFNSFNNFQIEEGACGGCHSAPMFNDGADRNTNISAYDDHGGDGNGRGVNVGLDKISKDKGTGDGSFKIPSLRNIELTGPYMHDGRFKTLEEVVTHYNEKVQAAPNLHRKLKDDNGKPKKLNLTAADQKALVAFLKTLTDKKFTQDPKYSDPFGN